MFIRVSKRSLIGIIFAIAILFTALILFTPSPAPAIPTITWSPNQVFKVVSPGFSNVLDVQFTSSENITNITVKVAPELQPYLRTEPTAFSSLNAGVPVDLTLIIDVPSDAILRVFTGTIQLKSSEKPARTFAKPLPATVEVKESSPEIVLSDIVFDLRRGDVDRAIGSFTPRDKTERVLRSLDSSQLNQLAYWLENSELVEAQDTYRVYRYSWFENSEENWVTFVFSRDKWGQWKLDSW